MDQTKQNNKNDDSKIQSNPLSTPIGGMPEGQPMSLENNGDLGNEIKETQEKNENLHFGEKAKEISKEQYSGHATPQAQHVAPKTTQKSDQIKDFPKVYGYKIPASMQKNLSTVRTQAGKGNPKNSVTWLRIFVDRLLKMDGN